MIPHFDSKSTDLNSDCTIFMGKGHKKKFFLSTELNSGLRIRTWPEQMLLVKLVTQVMQEKLLFTDILYVMEDVQSRYFYYFVKHKI